MGTDFFFTDYLNFLAREKKYSPHTLLAYENDLSQWACYFEKAYEISDPDKVTLSMVRSFIAEQIQAGMEPRSVNRKISALRSFFKFALRQGKVRQNPLRLIHGPKASKRLPVYVEKSQMEKLLSAEITPEFSSYRDHLILELLYGTGIRLSEALQLKEQDIDLNQGHLKVLGKRNKERIVPITHHLGKLIRNYLDKKSEQGFQAPVLLVSDKGLPMYPRLVYQIVNKNLSEVSTLQKKSPHVLRHTYATHLLDNGAELNAIKELLGHSSLAATQVYTHNSIERLKEVYKQAHPKS